MIIHSIVRLPTNIVTVVVRLVILPGSVAQRQDHVKVLEIRATMDNDGVIFQVPAVGDRYPVIVNVNFVDAIELIPHLPCQLLLRLLKIVIIW